jgi:DNA-binding NarL/FixJ family response regulator
MSNKKIRIAILDDHVGIREGFRAILNRVPYVTKVSAFASSIELLREHQQNKFDLMMIDIKLKDENGLEICKSIRNFDKKVKILIFSSFQNDTFILNAFHFQANGFLFKDADLKEIRNALDVILLENKDYFNYPCIQNVEPVIKTKSVLSKIEFKVAFQICEGKSTKEIATILNLQTSTINTHRNRIWKKLAIHKSTELIHFMVSQGLYIPAVLND